MSGAQDPVKRYSPDTDRLFRSRQPHDIGLPSGPRGGLQPARPRRPVDSGESTGRPSVARPNTPSAWSERSEKCEESVEEDTPRVGRPLTRVVEEQDSRNPSIAATMGQSSVRSVWNRKRSMSFPERPDSSVLSPSEIGPEMTLHRQDEITPAEGGNGRNEYCPFKIHNSGGEPAESTVTPPPYVGQPPQRPPRPRSQLNLDFPPPPRAVERRSGSRGRDDRRCSCTIL